MNTEWDRVNQLFHEAIEYAVEERAEFIARAVPNDPALQHKLQSLIAAHEKGVGFLENPAPGKSLFRRFGEWQRQIVDSLKVPSVKVSSGAGGMIGQLLDGKYKLEALCGRGGMGEVYRATHLGTGRRMAVKVIAPERAGDSEFIERFRREARTIGLLRHPNIVSVTDFGVIGEGERTVAYLVMEYLEGRTLAERLKDSRPMPINEAIAIISQAREAMDEAHRVGVLHRDLKPENIWLEPASATGSRVKILDFGVASMQDVFESEELEPPPEFGGSAILRQPFPIAEDETFRMNNQAQQSGRFGFMLGTPKYMSPEQCRGERLDKSSDIYSLGVIAYQLLAGEPPFTGTTPELLIQHREAEPAPLTAKRRDIPGGVDEIIRQALAKDKNARPATAGAFAFLLQLRYAGSQWVGLQAGALNRKYRWKFVEIAVRTQLKGWLLSLLLTFATLGLPGMSPATSVAVFSLLWLIVSATVVWGQNANTAACAVFIQQTEGGSKTDIRSIVADVRRRRLDLARAAFRLITPPLIYEGLSVEEAKRRWATLRAPVRQQAAYALFRRVLAFALGLTVLQQILTASAFILDNGAEYFHIDREAFLRDMSISMFFWLLMAVIIGIVAFSLFTKSAIEQSVIYLSARKARGELSPEQRALLPDLETWQVRRRAPWTTYAPACAVIALIIGFHLSKFPWMNDQMRNANLYSVKALNASGIPVPQLLGAPDEPPVFIGSTKLTQYLIEKGMDVNAPFRSKLFVEDPFGDEATLSPLMAVLCFNEVASARLLIEHGADAHARDSLGRTTMATAALHCPEAIELLLASGVDINEPTRFGPPLLIAARYQSAPIIFDKDAFDKDAFDKDAFAYLEDKFSQQNIAVKILIEKGADPNARDSMGRNALMVMSLESWSDWHVKPGAEAVGNPALARREDEIVEFIGETLLNAGCEVNAVDNEGRTPLMYAVASERPTVVEMLLKRGANVNAKDHNGESALDWAVKSGNDEIRRLILSFLSSGRKKISR